MPPALRPSFDALPSTPADTVGGSSYWHELLEAARRACRTSSARADEVDDAAQEAMLHLLRAPRPPTAPKAWLATVARRGLHHLRQRQEDSYRRFTDEDPGTSRAAALACADVEALEALGAWATAIASLPPVQRAIVELHCLQGWHLLRVAQHLRCAISTARSHLCYARATLRVLLDAEGHAPRRGSRSSHPSAQTPFREPERGARDSLDSARRLRPNGALSASLRST